ncbi:MAG: glycoside hydrolase family 9 protein [Mariniphaga sp.]|nr:glycoside hydrolase family 9 protein [Mariniphaga sp.]
MNTQKILNLRYSLILILNFIVFLSVAENPQTSKYIVIDQFGYRPDAKKIAVIRNPQVGFDAEESFTPGNTYVVINKADTSQIFTGTPEIWKNGATDESSGDKAWWFDFSSVTTEGVYYILDVDSNLCSFEFEIKENIYEEVLIQAVRTFYYQRSGFAKEAPFACEEWADGASHLQDKNARDFLAKNDVSTEVDVSGGWYDAGDYNKYTNWTSNYIVHFMLAFIENPGVWGDDFNIPESGNNIPDLLDEAKWGLDHLLRMQRPDGSMLSVVGAAHASPPSTANDPSYYGRPNTSGTLNSAGAFALASKVYRSLGMASYADSLKKCAVKAWDWTIENPNVIFNNNSGNTSGLAAGNQETDDYGRFIAKMEAAVFLYEITADPVYKSFFENNYQNIHLMQWTFAYPFETSNQEILLYYTTLQGISPTVASQIKSKYKSAMEKEHNFAAFSGKKDPFMAHLDAYTWGSNGIKAQQGLIYTDYINYNINVSKNDMALEAAENYIHYLHGVNPLNIVYLSNMYDFGAENSVNEFYHSWFKNGSAKWDRVGESTYGPAPGFLTGGPNPSYNWDGCCPSDCGSSSNNARCFDENITPPKGQPKQKSYKDFNNSWPLNSWSVTENSCGSQLPYIRLLAKFANANYDCAGVFNGSASYDICGICSGGTTGRTPVTDSENCIPTSVKELIKDEPQIFPNPTTNILNINYTSEQNYGINILNNQGQKIMDIEGTGNTSLNIQHLPSGNYYVIITGSNSIWKEKFVKL